MSLAGTSPISTGPWTLTGTSPISTGPWTWQNQACAGPYHTVTHAAVIVCHTCVISLIMHDLLVNRGRWVTGRVGDSHVNATLVAPLSHKQLLMGRQVKSLRADTALKTKLTRKLIKTTEAFGQVFGGGGGGGGIEQHHHFPLVVRHGHYRFRSRCFLVEEHVYCQSPVISLCGLISAVFSLKRCGIAVMEERHHAFHGLVPSVCDIQ